MANTATVISYEELQQKIKLHLSQAVEMNKISNENLLAVLFLLGQTTNVLELETFVEIFADAFDGKTVLAPSPVYPPQMPFTSSVGRLPVRSNVV